MPTSLNMISDSKKPAIDHDLLLDCVHCGLCTASCPTYVETGNEADSPRGRIYLMRQVIEEKLDLDENVGHHLDLCLDCRACETACPSGVQYGRLIEPFREHMESLQPGHATSRLNWLQRFMMKRIFPSRFRTRMALAPARLLQWSGIDWLLQKSGMLRLLPGSLRNMHAMLPKLKRHYGSLPEFLPAEGEKRATVALFIGCVADGIYPQTNYATAKVLQKNGCDVIIPRSQQCCGALHYHSAQEDEARRLVKANCEAFGVHAADWSKVDAVITNAAGCGAMLKELEHLMHDTPDAETALQFQNKVRDISEFLVELGIVPPTGKLDVRATYHDACHLRHAQQIQSPPRKLLNSIPGLQLVPLNESELCCGAAGSYNLSQPEMADKLGNRKSQNILATEAEVAFVGNVGCLMQITKHLKQHPNVKVMHPIDALWASYCSEQIN